MAEAYNGITGPLAAWMAVRDRNQQLGDQHNLNAIQQQTGLQGILASQMKMQQEQGLRGAVSGLGPDATPAQISAATRPYVSAADLYKNATESEAHRLTRQDLALRASAQLAERARNNELTYQTQMARIAASPNSPERQAAEFALKRWKAESDIHLRNEAGRFGISGFTPAPEQYTGPTVGQVSAPSNVAQGNATIAPTVSPADIAGITDPAEKQAAMSALMAGRFSNARPENQYSPAELAPRQEQMIPPQTPPQMQRPAPVLSPPTAFDMFRQGERNPAQSITAPTMPSAQTPVMQAEPVPLNAAVAPTEQKTLDSGMPVFTGSPKQILESQNRWRMQQARTSIAGAGTFTPQALEFTAKQYLSGDRQAAQGFARNSTARIALQNAIVEEAAKQGLTPEQTAAKMAEFAGTVAGSRTVGQRAANISLAATEAQEMLGIVKEQSQKFNATNFVPWNTAMRYYESNTGDPVIAAYGASINALVNVYARAINPTGVPTVSDKEHARAVINTVQSPGQVDAVLGIINRELEIAKKAPQQVREGIRQSVTGEGQTRRATDQPGAVKKYNPVTGKIE